jgi:hypothetical protein
MIEKTSDPRARFFNEEGTMIPPFVDSTWRGCALDRDRFDHTRMPEQLFHAIVSAAGSQELRITRYSPDSETFDTLAPTWESFRSFVFVENNWSLEYVLFDQSGQWAVLADADVTVVGASPDIAARIDRELSVHDLSLVQLTDTDFPDLDPAQQPGAKYLLAVSGR